MKRIFERAAAVAALFTLFAALSAFFAQPLSVAFAAPSGSDMDVLKDVELTAVSDGKVVKLGDLADGRPLFLIFSTAT